MRPLWFSGSETIFPFVLIVSRDDKVDLFEVLFLFGRVPQTLIYWHGMKIIVELIALLVLAGSWD